MSRTERLLWIGVALAGALAATVAVWRLWPVLFPQATEVAALDPACDLRAGPCVSNLKGQGRVSFSIEPLAIPVLKPLAFQVRIKGLEARRVQVDLSGVDMNMGFNRPQLELAAPGLFTGQGRLPVCVRNAMEWEARVLIDTEQGLIAAPYRFWTYRPGEGPR